jgi:hypothetical protein
MPLIPFGEYRPDVSDYAGQHTTALANVLPRGDGYGPFPDFTIFTAALPAVCRGFFFARKADGSVVVFAGTATRLYRLNNIDFGWSDVSKAIGAYSALPSTDQWQFAQFGNKVIAVQANTVPQVFDLASSTEFADLGGSPPPARYVSVVLRFLVLSGLLNDPYRVHWSGLNGITTWTPGTNQSDFQDFPDGGVVRGLAGGEVGLIMQDGAIRRMVYSRGSPTIFDIDRVSDDIGILAPLSLIRGADRVFFYSSKGFFMMTPTGQPVPIGKERVDRSFAADVDTGSFQLFVGAADPKASRVYWSYKSLAGQTGLFDKLLPYDWALDRWAPPIAVSGEFLAALAKPGLTLENLDAISGSVDALTFSLDDVSTAAIPHLAAVNASHRLGFYNGAALEAILETPEQGAEARRIFVRGFRPITDAPAVFGAVRHRASVQAAAATTGETLVDAQGFCPQRIDTRYARARLRIPAGTPWSFAMGVEPDFVLTGER